MDVIVYSGGMDSFTLLNDIYISMGREAGVDRIHVLSFDYGQRHSKELDFACRVTKKLGLEHKIIDLSAPLDGLLGGSALTKTSNVYNIAVPEGHYEAATMKQTVVPGRNAMMLCIAAAYAESLVMADGCRGTCRVSFGAHSGDHHIYPDCRPAFVEAMAEAIARSSDHRVYLSAPYLDLTKGQILDIGLRRGLDYSQTWTCYKGEDRPCGKCGACVERAEAFAQNNAIDPLVTA